jgi:hypothetical protein
LDNQNLDNQKKYYGDKLDMEKISGLSLFLYSDSLILIAKNHNGAIIGGHIYSYQNFLELREIIENDILINASNTTGKLYVHNDHFCLVPSVLFDPSVKNTYLNFCNAVDEEKQEIFYEGVFSNNIQVVGAIEKEVLSILDNLLPDLEVAHGASFVLPYILEGKKNMIGQEVVIVAERNHMYLAGFTNRELKIFNRFPVENDQEFLKYTFSVLHQLAYDRMHCKITLLGDIAGIHVNLDVLNLYFKNLLHPDPICNQTYSPGAEKLKETKMLEAFWTA